MKKTRMLHSGLILYDERLLSHPESNLFTPDYWDRRGGLKATVGGRGASWMLHRDDGDWVLRHYRRGGAMRFLNDRYPWPGAYSWTRPFREWLYLHQMHQQSLPVAVPVAAHVARHALVWRGDLITERITGAVPLSVWLDTAERTVPPWRRIGQVLARFHAAGAAHPDLNAHNILIHGDASVWLIDFDRGRWRRPYGRWTQHNLRRLRRSLVKLSNEATVFQPWEQLMDGYRS